MWVKDPEADEIVKTTWAESEEVTLEGKLKSTGTRLRQWHRAKYERNKELIRELENELEFLQNQNVSNEVLARSEMARKELESLLEKEELYWLQRSRIDWLNYGNQNTTFFHRQASYRKRKNAVKGLEDSNGVFQEDPKRVKEIVVDYFTQLFSSQHLSPEGELLETIQPKIT
ncbi:hypothetical protein PTKIN_Ptkin11bG0120800 [Pterospermum kingtungense]